MKDNLNTLKKTVPINKESENNKTITYKIKLIDSFRFISSSLLNLVNKLLGGIHNNKYTDCKSYIECHFVKDNKLTFKCLNCNKNHEKYFNFNKDLMKRIANIFEFCNKNIKKFILLLRKNVYPYKYMDSRERYNETSLPDKKGILQ